MNPTLAKEIANYAELSTQALGKALQMAQQSAAEKRAATNMIPTVVEALCAAKMIDASRSKQAAQELGSSEGTMKILLDVLHLHNERVAKSATESAVSLGGPASDVATPEPSQSTGKVVMLGSRRGSNAELSPADRSLMRFVPGYGG